MGAGRRRGQPSRDSHCAFDGPQDEAGFLFTNFGPARVEASPKLKLFKWKRAWPVCQKTRLLRVDSVVKLCVLGETKIAALHYCDVRDGTAQLCSSASILATDLPRDGKQSCGGRRGKEAQKAMQSSNRTRPFGAESTLIAVADTKPLAGPAIMRDVHAVLRESEKKLEQVRREVEALRLTLQLIEESENFPADTGSRRSDVEAPTPRLVEQCWSPPE